MVKFFNLMKEHEQDLARLMTLENGKTLAEAKVRRTNVSAELLESLTMVTGREHL